MRPLRGAKFFSGYENLKDSKAKGR